MPTLKNNVPLIRRRLKTIAVDTSQLFLYIWCIQYCCSEILHDHLNNFMSNMHRVWVLLSVTILAE